MKVKIFATGNYDDLEIEINEWIEKFKPNIKDLKFNVSTAITGDSFSCLILFE